MIKKVLLCSNAYPPHFIGGAELVAHAQAKQLQNLGFDILVFTGDPSEHGRRHSQWREDYEGVPVHRIHLTYEDYDYNFVNFTHKDIEDYFKKIVLEFSPDIVHFHNIIGLSVGLIHIAKSFGIKTVVTLHDHWGFCFKNTLIKNNNEICQDFTRCSDCLPVIQGEKNLNLPIRMRQDYLAMQLEEVDAFISPSRYLANAYIRSGIPPEKIHIIWNGLDVGKFSNIRKIPDPFGRIRFTFIGYFGKHKGLHVLLEALRYLDIHQNFKLNLVGSGDLLEEYKKEIREKGLADKVKIWGKIERIESAYADTDVFILPSIWPENQPVTITEAMAAGIPVIAANSGGIPELVINNQTGFLFELGNAEDLAKKMLLFIQQPHLLKFFGDKGFERIKEKTLQKQIDSILKVYTSIPSPRKIDTSKKFIIACVGEYFPPESNTGIKLFSKGTQFKNYRIVMYDWLQKDQNKTIQLAWILNYTTPLDGIWNFLKNKTPLLVPQKNDTLNKLCRKAQCGLYYHNGFEIEECLKYLFHHENQRILMGKNGYKYLSRDMK